MPDNENPDFDPIDEAWADGPAVASADDATAEAPVASSAPAAPAPAPASRSWVISLAVLALVIGVATWGVFAVMQRGSARAMTETAVAAIEALVEGNADGLAAVSNESVRAGLTPDMRTKMQNSGMAVEYAEPVWAGNTATIRTNGAMGSGFIIAEPSEDGTSVIVYRTMGAIGFTSGAVSLQRSGGGWVVSGIAVDTIKHETTSTTEPTTTP